MTLQMTAHDYHQPRSLGEASSILLEGGSHVALLAGGTDLLVRMKRAQRSVDVVVDLSGIDELGQIEERVKGLWIGSMARAYDIANNESVRRCFPLITQAASQVGGNQIRTMATLGGALAGGLRCQFYDQSRFWRGTLGPCLKSGGELCHAQPKGVCVATVASDLPVALVAAGGSITIQGPEGDRELPAHELYSGEGLMPLRLKPGEIITGALLPWSRRSPLWLGKATKVRLRRAIDRPLVGLAVAVQLSESRDIEALHIALCGHGPAVGLVPGLEAFVGTRLDVEVTSAIARAVSRWFAPTPALRVDIPWRRAVAGVIARRSLDAIIAETEHDALTPILKGRTLANLGRL